MKIEGKNAVVEILNTDYTIDKILMSKEMENKYFEKILNLSKGKNIKIQKVDKNILDKESVTKHHQGIIAYTTDFKYTDFEVLCKKRGLIVILDKIEDVNNFASIIRSCECAGTSGIIIPKNRSVSVNETIIRISTGACMHTPIARVTNINDAIKTLKSQNYFVFALDMDGENIFNSNIKGDIALVVGSEGNGVSALTRKLCDGILSIPMKGKVNSLNASNACAIGLFEYVRQNLKG